MRVSIARTAQAAALIAAMAGPAAAQAPLYETEVGRACIQDWTLDTQARLNRYDGSREFNGRKPWSINRYGLFVAKGIASAYEPDDWERKGATRDGWMWLTYTSELRYPDWGNANFNGARVLGLRWYVRDCVARRTGDAGPAPGPGPGPGPGGNPCAGRAPSAAMAPFANTVWQFGNDTGRVYGTGLVLAAGGAILGYSHPNESRWTVSGGWLVFCRNDGTPSAIYVQDRIVGGRRELQGPYYAADGTRGANDHVLRAVSETGTIPWTGGNPCTRTPDGAGMRAFQNTIWQFGNSAGRVHGEGLILLPGGDVGGYDHPNESRWTVAGGRVAFCRPDDSPSVIFVRDSMVGGRRELRGPFIHPDGRRDVTEHILRAQGTMPVAGGMGAGINLPGRDIHNFPPRRAEPALCRAACEADARCVAWTYVRPGAAETAPRCWLKNALPTPRMDPCCVSGRVE